MKSVKLLTIFLVVIFSATGCGDDSDSDGNISNPEVSAPSSFAGKSYRLTINTGVGFFATTGTSTVAFSNTVNTYKALGDGVNSFNSSGSYTYTTSGSQGNAVVVDSSFSNGNFILTFTSSTTGTYQATSQSDPNSNQTGSFIEL
jgi:hypothetical protein